MAWSPNVRQMVVQQQGGNSFVMDAEWNDQVVLVANAAQSYNVTAMKVAAGLNANQGFFLIYGADGPFWANPRGTASFGTGKTDGSGSIFSPNQRWIGGDITAISLIAPAATNVSLQIYKT